MKKKIAKSDKDKLTLADAARMLNVCKRTVQKAIRDGLLEPVTRGIHGYAYWVTRASVTNLLVATSKNVRGGAA